MSKVAMALVGAGVVTLAVLCLQQQQTLATEREALARARDQHAVREREVAGVAAQAERLQTELARLPSAAELPPPDPVEIERKRLDLIVRKGAMDSYAPLFRHLKLSREQVDAFKTLLVERAQAIYDAGKLAEEEGVVFETLAEREELEREASREIDAQIANVIGAEKFKLFTDYQRPLGAFPSRLRWEAEQSDDPTVWDRANALGDLWERTGCEAMEQAYAQNTAISYPPAFLDGAKAIVTEPEYRRLIADVEDTRIRARMLEIERAAAYAGKLKLSKSSARDYGKPFQGPPSEVRLP